MIHERFAATAFFGLLLIALSPGIAQQQEATTRLDKYATRGDLHHDEVDTNPRPGQPGHRAHVEWEGRYPTPESIDDFKVVRTMPLPQGFLGNLTYDLESGRLFLMSLGPPTNVDGPSRLYEIDPASGHVLAQADMPFEGDFGEPVLIDGALYQGVFHESKMYRVSVASENFGEIEKVIPLPTINDLNLVDEAHSFPFIEFGGVTVTPDGNLVIHADDVGEFIKIDRETGAILNRASTIKAMGGITGLQVGDRFLVVGNSDPRGGYCALSYPPLLSRSPEQRDISWALADGYSGEILASLRRQNSRAYAGTVTLLSHQPLEGTPFGVFRLLATGEEGLIEIEWIPGRNA